MAADGELASLLTIVRQAPGPRLLSPRERTLSDPLRMSEKCQQRKWRRLFDHLVRPREQCRRNGQPAGLCGSQVHDQLKPCWTLNRYIGGSGTFEYFVYVKSHSPHNLHGIWSI